MERTYINEAQKAIGGTVKVQGFIENLRNSKYMAFIVLKDITGKLQITVEKEDHPDLVDTIDQLTPDSVITVTGKVVENDYVKMGGVEMIPESIEIAKVIESFGVDGIVLSGGFVSKAPMLWSAPASTSALITAGSTCAPTRTSLCSRHRAAL